MMMVVMVLNMFVSEVIVLVKYFEKWLFISLLRFVF